MHHPHKNNALYNLPKRVIVFVICKDTMNRRLREKKYWLTECHSLDNANSKIIYDAAL